MSLELLCHLALSGSPGTLLHALVTWILTSRRHLSLLIVPYIPKNAAVSIQKAVVAQLR